MVLSMVIASITAVVSIALDLMYVHEGSMFGVSILFCSALFSAVALARIPSSTGWTSHETLLSVGFGVFAAITCAYCCFTSTLEQLDFPLEQHLASFERDWNAILTSVLEERGMNPIHLTLSPTMTKGLLICATFLIGYSVFFAAFMYTRCHRGLRQRHSTDRSLWEQCVGILSSINLVMPLVTAALWIPDMLPREDIDYATYRPVLSLVSVAIQFMTFRSHIQAYCLAAYHRSLQYAALNKETEARTFLHSSFIFFVSAAIQLLAPACLILSLSSIMLQFRVVGPQHAITTIKDLKYLLSAPLFQSITEFLLFWVHACIGASTAIALLVQR